MKSQAAVLRGVGKDWKQADRLPDDPRSTPRGATVRSPNLSRAPVPA